MKKALRFIVQKNKYRAEQYQKRETELCTNHLNKFLSPPQRFILGWDWRAFYPLETILIFGSDIFKYFPSLAGYSAKWKFDTLRISGIILRAKTLVFTLTQNVFTDQGYKSLKRRRLHKKRKINRRTFQTAYILKMNFTDWWKLSVRGNS